MTARRRKRKGGGGRGREEGKGKWEEGVEDDDDLLGRITKTFLRKLCF